MIEEGYHLIVAILIVQKGSGGNWTDELSNKFTGKESCLRVGIDFDESDFIEVSKFSKDVELEILETHLLCRNFIVLYRK